MARQGRNGVITVIGWAFNPATPTKSITVGVWSRGRLVRLVRANRASTAVDHAYRLSGRHGFRVRVVGHRNAVELVLHTDLASHHMLSRRRVLSPGDRIAAIARRFVGHVRYVSGGDSPRTGFDCSGLTQYAYRMAHVALLPHLAQAQRFAAGMHRISPRAARRGDLVFYLSGNYAYHVAIYAGHGRQYAAADPAQGIRFQRIWSHHVQYATDWH